MCCAKAVVQMTYGCGIEVTETSSQDSEEGSEQTEVDHTNLMQLIYEQEKQLRLLNAVLRERHLPAKQFGIRFGADDLVGM